MISILLKTLLDFYKKPNEFDMKFTINIFAFLLLCSSTIVAQNNGSCIGKAGEIEWDIWHDVDGLTLDWLDYLHDFPNKPDRTSTLYALSTTLNYSDYYAGRVRGFIKAPESGSYLFNITGDDDAIFFLSSDSTSNNLDTICYAPGSTEQDNYTLYPEQTSALVTLTAGEYYYFEGLYNEAWGNDFIQIQWKLPSAINSPDWTIIYGDYLYAPACDNNACPPRNTICDDGNPNTSGDVEDGYCNCYGVPNNTPSCVGSKGDIKAQYFANIPGTTVADLYGSPSYPNSPTHFSKVENLNGGNMNLTSFGTRVQCMLYVPVTGDYQFNITGYSQVNLKLSSSTDPALATDVAYMTWTWVGQFDHETNPTQTSAVIPLVGGNFYYLELEHKGDDIYNRFDVFWKTPFMPADQWHFLDDHYLYDYTCPTACLPQGYPCDDGDPMTYADKIDDNCNCVGSPCSDPACSEINPTPVGNCALTDEHSNSALDSWKSCLPKVSPNPTRGTSHWIQYDFGATYLLNNSQIWNYNVANQTGQGFQEVVIDYSVDGVNWTELGQYSWAEASGLSNYGGFNFPDFNGVAAQYVLITSLSNFDGSNCVGISEISFDAQTCPDVGTPCDDGNPDTPNDMYNAFCICTGMPQAIQECTDLTMNIPDRPVVTNTYDVIETIISDGRVDPGTTVNYLAGECITLNVEFEVRMGGDFFADIVPCAANAPLVSDDRHDKPYLQLKHNIGKSKVDLFYKITKPANLKFDFFNAAGELLSSIEKDGHRAGRFQLSIPSGHLYKGVYFVKLFIDGEVLMEKVML